MTSDHKLADDEIKGFGMISIMPPDIRFDYNSHRMWDQWCLGCQRHSQIQRICIWLHTYGH